MAPERYIYIYICIYKHTHTHTYIYIYTLHIHIYIYIYTYIYIRYTNLDTYILYIQLEHDQRGVGCFEGASGW